MDAVTVSEWLNDAVSLATSVATATKALTRAGAKQDPKAVAEVLALALALEASMVQLQASVLQLQQENRDLRAQVRREEERALDREGYERRNIRGSIVVVPKGDPDTYLCANCFEAGRKVYLTKIPRSMHRIATHYCRECEATFGTP